MKEISTTVGFANITGQRIKNWAWNGDDDELEVFEDDEFFTEERFQEARTNLVRDIIQNCLYFGPGQIKIRDVRAGTKGSGILYARAEAHFVKEIFIRAAKVQNPDANVIQYTPSSAQDRKRSLERILGLFRNKAPKGTIKTQLRPGLLDYIPYIKIKQPHGSGFFAQKSLKLIDPNNEAAYFVLRGYTVTEETQERINHARRTSEMTLSLNRDHEQEDGGETFDDEGATNSVEVDAAIPTSRTPTQREDDAGLRTTENKRKRNSPGEHNNGKKFREADENEGRIVANMYRTMGLEMLIEC